MVLHGKGDSVWPISALVPYVLKVPSAASNFQLAIAPWMVDPTGKTIAPDLIKVSNFNGAAGSLSIWDQDLTNAGAPGGRGSAGSALITIGFAASPASGTSASEASFSIDEGTLPIKEFRAGIALQSTVLNVTINANVRVIA